MEGVRALGARTRDRDAGRSARLRSTSWRASTTRPTWPGWRVLRRRAAVTIDADTYARPDSWTAPRGARRGPGWPPSEPSSGAARGSPSCRSGRPGHHATARPGHGLLPASTTSPSPRPRARRSASGSSSSTGTCTTATAPRTSSGTTPTCSTSRPINIPLYPGTGRPDEVGGAGRAGTDAQPPVCRRARPATWCGPPSTTRPRHHRGLRPGLGAGLVRVRRPPGRSAERPAALER